MPESKVPAGNDDRARVRDAVRARLQPHAWPDTRFVYDLTHFLPGYAGCERLPDQLGELACWQGRGPIYATPDNCLEGVRSALIAAHRPLLQTIAVRMGFRFFAPGSVAAGFEQLAGTLDGADRLSGRLDLEAVAALGPLDAVITGCRAVSLDGVRMGKGFGWFDLEWGILTALGVAGEETPVIVACHDVQLLHDDEVLAPSPHDTLVDWIVTPTRVIHVDRDRAKPHGIQWDRLRPEQVASVPSLRDLQAFEARTRD